MEIKLVETKQELDDAFTIRKMVFVGEQNVPEEEEIDQFDQEATHFILYHEGKAAGAGRFRLVDGVGKVERICVLGSLRRTGGGTALMKKIEEYAKGNRVPALKLNAQTHAIPFYTNLGYEVMSEEFLEAGIPHKTMKKTL